MLGQIAVMSQTGWFLKNGTENYMHSKLQATWQRVFFHVAKSNFGPQHLDILNFVGNIPEKTIGKYSPFF